MKNWCLIFFLFLSKEMVAQKLPLKLWYNKPAVKFEDALVMGNGQQGAAIFGGPDIDQIYLNDITLWSGGPVNPNMNPDAYKILPEVRALLNEEKYVEADEAMKKMEGKWSESYAPLGTMYIEFGHKNYKNYYRELSLDSAITKINYQTDDNTISKEYFYSYPDKCFVIKLKSKREGGLNFNVKFNSLIQFHTCSNFQSLEFGGRAPYKAQPDYVDYDPNPIAYSDSLGTRFFGNIFFKEYTGKFVKTDSTIGIKNGTSAIIIVNMATSFKSFDQLPDADETKIVKLRNNNLKNISFASLKENHIKDYRHFFTRVYLDLKPNAILNMPTNERLMAYTKGQDDKYLEMLYFQFGRYLLISSSRTNGVPTNLQGLWNHYVRPPWACNYTVNINTEQNYWPVETTNLSELHQPLLGFIENLRTTGEITAKTFYNAHGWACNHNSDIWAMTNPVGDFGHGEAVFASWAMGGTWLSTHLWEHYIFTKDISFLKNKAYPLMKGAAEFCLDMLVKAPDGTWVTSPSTSPENRFVTRDGKTAATSFGATNELAIMRELFLDLIKASKTLHVDNAFRKKLESTLDNLHPYEISKDGSLKEWYYDFKLSDPTHRHQSHLFGLYPGTHIKVAENPTVTNAIKRTLEIKGDQTTGWSKAWRINLWARLLNGNRAYKLFRELLNYIGTDSHWYQANGGTYPNLLDAHPPFQIDGNFGGTAAIVEMLLQSSDETINLLPALPDAWKNGSINGIKARGGFEVDINWQNGKLISAKIKGKPGGKTTIMYKNRKKNIKLENGETFDWIVAQ